MVNLLAQGIGFVALILVFVSYQFNDRSRILMTLVIVQCLFIFHYALLGARIGAVMVAGKNMNG
jgi:hypothetical protein